MASKASALDATIQQKWEETLSASHEPDKTISANLEPTRRITRNSLSEGVHRLGYEMGAELGRGGLGLVSMATQQVFDRSVAIKRLLGGVTDRDASLKFFAEALITAQLEHPNIVPIHDLMTDATGQLQLVMKRVEGKSWRDLLHPRSDEHQKRVDGLTIDDHLDILLKVCDAVSFAHQRGFLHRDLKPENVMVGAFGEVLVMDWGCAVAFGDGDHHPVVPRVEEATHIAGTPSYMAPEMVLVQAARIGPHSDVYQLGAVLYEVLTLQKPHRGGNVYEVLKDAAQGTVVPPVQAAPGRSIPDELADICLAALVKDADTRIRAVGDLAQRIKDYRRHAQAVTLVSSARGYLAGAAKNRHGADDNLRKAVSAAEQAREIWSGWPVAAQMLLDATLAYALHHLDAGAATLAAVQAGRASILARELGRGDLVTAANALGVKARAAAAAQVARQRQLRFARFGLAAAGMVLVVGLVVFLALVTAEQRRTVAEQQRTAAALTKAEQALAALTSEKSARSSDQKTSAPALVAQARKAIAGKDWNAAITALGTAISFDPKLVEAHQLLVNVLAAAKRYGEVLTAGPRWQEVSGGDASATRLIAISRILSANPDPVKATETQLQLAELFERQGLFILAETTTISPAKRLALYRKRIDAAWPGVGAGVTMREDGKLVTVLSSHEASGFKTRTDVVDLEPIRGMPFAALCLDSTGVRKLDVLASMPLEELSIEQTLVTDLSPLHGRPLRILKMSNTKVADLSPLAGMPLTLLWAEKNPITDLSPLRGLPLDDLELADCRITDLAPLSGAPISILSVGNLVRDLSPLRGMPLKWCQIQGFGDLDLSPLAGAPLEDFSVGCNGSVDLAALPTSITTLRLWNVGLRKPADLARFRLRELQLDSARPAIDLRVLDGRNLEALTVFRIELIAPIVLTAPRLKKLSIGSIGDLSVGSIAQIDLAPLAACPLVEIRLGEIAPLTWRSLVAFRQSKTLSTVYVEKVDRAIPVAEFWDRYHPEGVGALVTVVAEPLAAIAPLATKPGLAWTAMDGIRTSVDEIARATPVATGITTSIHLQTPFPELRGMRFSGYLTVPKEGEYTFTVASDDGSRLLLGNRLVVDNDGPHAAQPISGRIRLTAGTYPLTLLYFNGLKNAVLTVTVAGPGVAEQELPPAWLSH